MSQQKTNRYDIMRIATYVARCCVCKEEFQVVGSTFQVANEKLVRLLEEHDKECDDAEKPIVETSCVFEDKINPCLHMVSGFDCNECIYGQLKG